MENRKVYKVAVTEILRKIVTVEAGSEAEAHRRASDAWQNGEYLLDGRDSDGVEFHVLGEDDGSDEKCLTHVEGKDAGVTEDGMA